MRLSEKQLGYSISMMHMEMNRAPEYEMKRRVMDKFKAVFHRDYPECAKCEHFKMDEQMDHMMDIKHYRLGCKLGPRPVCPDMVEKIREESMRSMIVPMPTHANGSVYPSYHTTTASAGTVFAGKTIDRVWIDDMNSVPDYAKIEREALKRKIDSEHFDKTLFAPPISVAPRKKDSPRTQVADVW